MVSLTRIPEPLKHGFRQSGAGDHEAFVFICTTYHLRVVYNVVKTQRKGAKPRFVPTSSQLPRNLRTFALQMAMDQAKREEVGDRLRGLRGPRPQRVIADAVGVTLRAYQAWEAGDSGINWDNLEAVAEFHEVDTTFILNGDGVANLNGTGDMSQLDRIEQLLHEIHAMLTAPAEGREGIQPPPGELGRRATDSQPKTAPPQRKRGRRAAGAKPNRP